MNEIVNKFLLPGDKFIPKIRLRPAGFRHSASALFTKNKERIHKIKERVFFDWRYIYQNDLDKRGFSVT